MVKSIIKEEPREEDAVGARRGGGCEQERRQPRASLGPG